jgi:hypothetical protein
MKRFVLLILLLLSTPACGQDGVVTTKHMDTPPATAAVPQVNVNVTRRGDVLVNCTYKYDSRYNIEFLARNKRNYTPPTFPELTVYRIVDTKNGRWSVNQYDWLNYTCTQRTL